MTKISFKVNRNTVTANAYLVRELYKRNANIVEELGGEMVQDQKVFTAKFPNTKLAKQFVEEEAVTHISKKEYNENRKTEPKKTAPKQGKGKNKADNFVIVTDSVGNTYQVEKSALKKTAPVKDKSSTTKKAPKGKGSNKKQMSEYEKRQKARKMTNDSFDEYVPYSQWKAKYDKIFASL